jgi:hypothetical protein
VVVIEPGIAAKCPPECFSISRSRQHAAEDSLLVPVRPSR